MSICVHGMQMNKGSICRLEPLYNVCSWSRIFTFIPVFMFLFAVSVPHLVSWLCRLTADQFQILAYSILVQHMLHANAGLRFGGSFVCSSVFFPLHDLHHGNHSLSRACLISCCSILHPIYLDPSLYQVLGYRQWLVFLIWRQPGVHNFCTTVCI